ncbi:hypothetical protein QTJ16_006604 [Diplocarpon rosae]|uniref:N(6)-L-threonylcarbamoyladenine synthase n=1 Tax=Diplocarpon rosae TaxID=946125 RepID=A0AAD9WA92_9HELO|nr:hypothetical protein QTJ16_006604 [Diplocarpon rosae]PBP18413.1 glycoprotease family protein [Diplocarpon rosae]
MRLSCLHIKNVIRFKPQYIQRRSLLTLAIETSCDDTSVALLEKQEKNSAKLYFHEKITSDNRAYGGIHPIAAHESHQKNLSTLVNRALQKLPDCAKTDKIHHRIVVDATLRRKPDFITVTRGPGMRASLVTGIDTAKGLAVAWQIPLLGVNHMQAHALTPRLVSALESRDQDPSFPFLTLLVSGGHTMLVLSEHLCAHKTLANTTDMAIGDMIDKCARDILPRSYLNGAVDVMYGQLLESFTFPDSPPDYNYVPPKSFNSPRLAKDYGYDWAFNPPYSAPGPEGSKKYANAFTYSGIGSQTSHMTKQDPGMDESERRVLARLAMEVAFEHLASRVLFALERPEMKNIKALVVSGGVASNQFLKAILRVILDANGYGDIRIIFPPPNFCTDNAAMIAWTGIEMYERGWRTNLQARALRKWALDPCAEDGGICDVDGWDFDI